MISIKLAGSRIMVVDDELLVAMMVEETLIEEGCEVVGPFARLSEALLAATWERLDGAVLDVNVGGEMVYPVAEMLASRSIPFVFVSGYGKNAIPSDRPNWMVCSKPFLPTTVVEMMKEAIQASQLH